MGKHVTVRSLVSEFLGSIGLFSFLLLPSLATAGSYADSARGNSGYGVSRFSLPTYVTGNCGHCHEQHSAEADGVLLLADSFSGVTSNPYATTDSLCFQCHRAVGSLQSGGIINNNYSSTFGGAPATDLQSFHHQVRSGFSCEDCHLSSDRSAGIHECTDCHFHGSFAGAYKTF